MSDIFTYITTHWFTLLLIVSVFLLGLKFIFASKKSYLIIYGLLIWFPLETLILRYAPVDYYALLKYLPEVVLYGMVGISWYRYNKRTGHTFPHTPINKWFGLFLLIAIISLIINWYSPLTWALGIRQLLRFALISAIIFLEEYNQETLKHFVYIAGGMILLEAFFGIVQFAMGGRLDHYLFFSESITVGGAQLEGLQQFWAPGQRVFATLGRYDRLGSLLAIGIVMLVPWLYEIKDKVQRFWIEIAATMIVVALVLTYSRASWIAAVVGVVVVAIGLYHDKRIIKYGGILAAIFILYFGAIIVTENYGGGVLDKSKQSLTERTVEAVSWYSWQLNYEGYGRLFFIINTPYRLVRDHVFFGVGAGNYGGGVAAALGNKKAYDLAGLPFGIQNTYGQIDNNWMSIWGEAGTLGLIVWIMIFVTVYKTSSMLSQRFDTAWKRNLARGLCGVTVAIAILGFFGPYFEFRTLMVYYWLLVAIVLQHHRERRHAGNFIKQ